MADERDPDVASKPDGYISTGVPNVPNAIGPEDEKQGPPVNGFSMNADPMSKMCYHCARLHRDRRPDATPEDASVCPKCVAKGIAPPPMFSKL